MNYLITSATGDLAQQSLEHLIALVGKESVFATVRSLDKATALTQAGITVRQADYFDRDSLVSAFEGIDRVLFVSSGELQDRQIQHKNVVDALNIANVEFVAYTSAPHADTSTSLIAPDHKATEEWIQASGIDYAFLRNNWYLENEGVLLEAIEQNHPFFYSAGEGKTGWAKKADYAEAAARVLAGVVPMKPIYEFGGTPLTYEDLAVLLQEGKAKPIDLIATTDEEYAKKLTEAGLPQEAIGFIIGIQKDIRDGQLNVESEDLAQVLGRKLTLR